MSLISYRMVIDGVAAEGVATLDVINPATARPFATVPDCTREQLDAAVTSARRAQKLWRSTPIEERKSVVAALGTIITDNMDELKRLLTSEQGKPHDAAADELAGAAYWFQTADQLALPVEVIEDTPERLAETRHVPLGVIGAILPWNFPILLMAWKIVPALVAGNSIILKPSPYTPATSLRIGELMIGALPPGLINVVSGGDELGRWITEHDGIDKISFTGSNATGKNIVRSASSTMKRVTLEMGGNDPAIVFPDVDTGATAQSLFWGAFGNTGQICVAAKRIYVHEDIFDEFAEKFAAIGRELVVGDGSRQGTSFGPIQNKLQFDRVQSLIADSTDRGHKVTALTNVPDGDGYFIAPTIVENPPEDSRVVVEEAFGPVVPLLKFSDEMDVVERANNTPYGLAGSVWSKDTKRAESVAAQLECGTVWINSIHDSPADAPIAGHKQSGLGIENGPHGLLEFTNIQTVIVRREPPVV